MFPELSRKPCRKIDRLSTIFDKVCDQVYDKVCDKVCDKVYDKVREDRAKNIGKPTPGL
jgi:hypothetical protein